MLYAPADIVDLQPRTQIQELPFDQAAGVLDRQHVPHLAALPAVVGQRQAQPVGNHPPGHPPLLSLAPLPRAGQAGEAVADPWEAEGVGPLLNHQIGRDLAAAVEAAGSTVQRAQLGDRGSRTEPILRLLDGPDDLLDRPLAVDLVGGE